LGTWLDQPSERGIAAFGTAISGMVPGAILGFLSTWLVYRYGKRAMVALLKYLKEWLFVVWMYLGSRPAGTWLD
jgi:hypothetical protein